MKRARNVFAAGAGVAIIVWWAATWLDVLPTSLRPVQLQASHAVAELLLAGLLLFGVSMQRSESASGRVAMAAGFGGLLYATVNATGGFADRPAMLALLLLAGLAAVASLSSMVWDSRRS